MAGHTGLTERAAPPLRPHSLTSLSLGSPQLFNCLQDDPPCHGPTLINPHQPVWRKKRIHEGWPDKPNVLREMNNRRDCLRLVPSGGLDATAESRTKPVFQSGYKSRCQRPREL